MRGTAYVLACVLFAGCGGNGKPPETAESESEKTEEAQPEPKSEPKSEEPKSDDKEKTDEGGEKPAAGAKEPEFKEGISVEDAINAIPQGTPRVNIDQETLDRPLMNEALYKPCKLAPSQHFKLKVAIWDGKAVGIDVSATPDNPKAVQCIKDQVKSVTWKDAVKSLNTIEYNF